MKTAVPNPATPADQIAELRREFAECEARRDKEAAELWALVGSLSTMIAELQCANAEREAKEAALERNNAARPVDENKMAHRPPGDWRELKVAAGLVNKSEAWIFKWRKRGLIPEFLEGASVFVDIDVVQAWAALAPSQRRRQSCERAHCRTI